MARILGVDHGERRLGFAVCDPTEMIATPLCVVHIKDEAGALAETKRLIGETGAESVVVGLPLNMNGTIGPAALKVREFINRLHTEAAIEVFEWDERMTTQFAERVLLEADVRRQERRGIRDMLAAQGILQSFIDARHGPGAAPFDGDSEP